MKRAFDQYASTHYAVIIENQSVELRSLKKSSMKKVKNINLMLSKAYELGWKHNQQLTIIKTNNEIQDLPEQDTSYITIEKKEYSDLLNIASRSASLWHSPEEEPDGRTVLVVYKKCYTQSSDLYHSFEYTGIWKFIVKKENINTYAYIEDLLKIALIQEEWEGPMDTDKPAGGDPDENGDKTRPRGQQGKGELNEQSK